MTVLPPTSDWVVRPGKLQSRFADAQVGYVIARPFGSTRADAPAPVVICLPGRGDAARSWVESLLLADYAAQVAVRPGARPVAIGAIDGGESYWHRRESGEDRLAMLMQEFLPLLALRGLGVDAADRAIAGWSMGGYGALLAAIRSPGTFAAVSVVSPALWTSPGETAAGAFDDADDYRRNDVFARSVALRGTPVRIDCGNSDPFIDATRTFAARLPVPATVSYAPGCHDGAYWRAVAPKQLDWIAGQLTR